MKCYEVTNEEMELLHLKFMALKIGIKNWGTQEMLILDKSLKIKMVV